jgi:hypothetical protein
MIQTPTQPQPPAPGRSGGRTAWRIAGTLSAVLTLIFGTANVVAALAHDTWHVHRTIQLHRSIAAPVRVVDVESSGGSISVLGVSSSSDGVSVDMTVSRGLETPTHTEMVEGDRLVIRNHCGWAISSWCQIDYVLHVPSGVSVIAHSDGGDVTASNVHGDVELTSSGGAVNARDVVASRLGMHSDGGDITGEGLSATSIEASTNGGNVSLVLDTAPTNVQASSDGGDVEIALPDTPDAYRVQLSSDGGETSGPIRTDPTSSRVITASSNGGNVTVRYRTS